MMDELTDEKNSPRRVSNLSKLKERVVGGVRRLFSRSRSVDLQPTSPSQTAGHHRDQERQWKRQRRSASRETEGEKWNCAKCTFDNERTAVCCQMCGNSKVKVKPDNSLSTTVSVSKPSSFEDISSWKCGHCRFSNPSSANNCGNCGQCKDISQQDIRTEQNEIKPSSSDGAVCHFCTFVNPEGTRKCKTCHHEMTEGVDIKKEAWNCDRCSCINELSATYCLACGREKKSFKPADNAADKSSQVMKLSDNGMIACPHCTFMNEQKVEKCELCHQLMKVAGAMMKVAGAKKAGWWACGKCTFNNEPNKTRCSACDTPITAAISGRHREEKQQSKTWTCSKCTFNNPEVESWCQICSHGHNIEEQRGKHIQRQRAPTLGRQASWSMELKRQVDEQEAIDQWHNIVFYCRRVRAHTQLSAVVIIL